MKLLSARRAAPIRFVLLGAISFTTNLCITAGLHELVGVSPDLSFAVGLVTVFALNFAAMRWWVFPDGDRSVGTQLTGFAMTSVVFRGAEFGLFLLLRHVGGTYYLFAAGGTLCFSMLVKYFVYGSWLFARARR